MREQLQYYLPPYNMVTSPYLKQVLKGDKKFLKAAEVRICNPPHYDEISVTRLYDKCILLPGMADYFPDKYPKGRQCAREYFFSVLSTLHPDYTRQLLLKSKKDRFAGEEEEDVQEQIEIAEEWADALKAFPQFSRSKGRMVRNKISLFRLMPFIFRCIF